MQLATYVHARSAGLTSQDPEQLLTPVQQAVQQLLHSDTPKPASAALRPEFFVILADCTAPGAQHPAVLPPPDPKPKGMEHEHDNYLRVRLAGAPGHMTAVTSANSRSCVLQTPQTGGSSGLA